MVHLFLVKSWITHLVARAIIRRNGIDPDDVLLLAVRGFHPHDPSYRTVVRDYGPGAPQPFPAPHKLRAWRESRRLLREFDAWVEKEMGGRPFHYYSTNSRQRYNRVLLSHPLCRGFSFIESGSVAYRTREELLQHYRDWPAIPFDRFLYDGRILEERYFGPGYEAVYGVGPLAFPGYERRVVLEDVFEGVFDGSADDIENVLVFDALTAHSRLGMESVVSATRRTFDRLREQGARSVHYKFHPAQTFTGEHKELEQSVAEAAGDIATQQLDASVILEGLAYQAPHVRFWVNCSSVGIYAAQAGCKVYSYAPYIADVEEKYRRILDTFPRAFAQNVEFLA